MSFDMFVTENPFQAYDSSDDDELLRSPPAKEQPVTRTVELGKMPQSQPSRFAPGVAFPAIAYMVAFAWLVQTTEYSKFLIHIAAVCVGFFAERLRESIVRQMKLEEMGDESILGVALYTVPIVVAFKGYEMCIAQPMNMVLQALGVDLEAVDIDRVPMERRKQTFAVLLWSLLIPMIPFAYMLAFSLTLTLPVVMIPYWFFIYYWDRSPRDGSRKTLLRNVSWGRHFVNYFPITLQRASAPLDPSRRYVFAFHPHGIISLGAIGVFGTNASGFDALFPGIDRHLMTLDSNFKVPFLREIILWLGACSVARKSCDAILARGPGSAICIVVGGAAESLETEEGTYRLILKRKGFVKVACENDADLVPVFAFGENDVFTVLHPDKDSKLHKWQRTLQKRMGFAIPIFWGRSVFSYNWGFLPKRKPINVVTGPPITITEFRAKGLTGDQLIDAVHEAYVEGLRELFDEFKDRTPAGMTRRGSLDILE